MPRPFADVSHRVQVQFLEADVEIGFGLVDLAKAERLYGNSPGASRALEDVEGVFTDIQNRLLRLEALDRQPFGPLVDELRREIDAAKSHIM